MLVAMTYPPWLSKAYAKPVDPERGLEDKALAETGKVIPDGRASKPPDP
jgi:hypothetical protein